MYLIVGLCDDKLFYSKVKIPGGPQSVANFMHHEHRVWMEKILLIRYDAVIHSWKLYDNYFINEDYDDYMDE